MSTLRGKLYSAECKEKECRAKGETLYYTIGEAKVGARSHLLYAHMGFGKMLIKKLIDLVVQKDVAALKGGDD